MAGRLAPVPPFVDLPSLSRPQVVDEHGFELTDEQIEALAATVAGGTPVEVEEEEAEEEEEDDGDDEEEEVEEGEEEEVEEVQEEVTVGEEDVPEDHGKQPLLSLDQR